MLFTAPVNLDPALVNANAMSIHSNPVLVNLARCRFALFVIRTTSFILNQRKTAYDVLYYSMKRKRRTYKVTRGLSMSR